MFNKQYSYYSIKYQTNFPVVTKTAPSKYIGTPEGNWENSFYSDLKKHK